MKYFLFSLFTACVLFSCKNNTAGSNTAGTPASDTSHATDTTASQADTASAPQPFFPIADFIGGQMRYIDSLQLPLTKTVIVNNKSTLSSLPDAEFRALAAQFREPDISSPALSPFYKESSYSDRSISSIVFTYTATRPGLEIQKADVIIKQDASNNDKVRTIYIEKQQQSGDTLISRKLYWKVNRNFQVITEKRVNKTFLPVEQVKVVWDPSE